MKEIENRRSIRKYTDKKVEEQKLMQILESARLAPSGSNTQPWNFIIIESKEMKERIVAVDHNQSWMMTAPVFVAVIADISCRLEPTEGMYLDENSPLPELKQIIRDTAAAIENMLLEAVNLELSACWTGWYEQKEIRAVLNVPDDKYVCGVITIGYGDESPAMRPRRKLEDMIRFEKWQ